MNKELENLVEELEEKGFSVFMVLSEGNPFDQNVRIFSRKKDEPKTVYIHYWDGIHYFTKLERLKEENVQTPL